MPVTDALLEHIGGVEVFCRRIVGRITGPLDVDWAASRDASVTVRSPLFYAKRTEPITVKGPGFTKVAAAEPCTGADAEGPEVAQRKITYVWVTFDVVAAGESATDTSIDLAREHPDTPGAGDPVRDADTFPG